MKKFSTINPYTLTPLKTYAYENMSQVEKKVGLSRKAFLQWKTVTVPQRVKILMKALNYFNLNRKKIARDITAEMGKPLTQSHNEINGLFERAIYLLSIAEESLKPDTLPEKTGFKRQIIHEPLGVIFILSAWNYPLLIAINGVITALLSGNVVILKHSSMTTSIGKHFENAFKKIDRFDNLLQQIIVDHKTTEKLIKKNLFDHVIFTGSVNGGLQIKSAMAKSIIDCNLELGGKDGAYVAQDADLKYAVESIVDGAMYNAGQSCCGIERVYVHKTIYDQFITYAAELLSKYNLGDPMETSTTMGPLAQAKSAAIMEKQIKEAVKNGAKIICGGKKKIINQAVFFEPTLITNLKNNLAIMQEENFGPILPVIRVSDDEEAIRLINDSQLGLTSAIYTADEKKAQTFSEKVETGTVFMNRCDYLDPALPWTGYKLSGKGSILSKYGFYSLTKRKAIHFKLKERS